MLVAQSKGFDYNFTPFAKVAELVDALDLGSCGETRESSSLSFRIFKLTLNEAIMNVTVVSEDGLKRQLKITVPAERVEDLITQRLTELLPNAKLPGFREGKVPMSHVRRKYEAGVRQEVVSDLIRETLFQAIEEQGLKPAGSPTVESMNVLAGQPLEYEASLEVMPEVKLKPLKGFNLTRYNAELTDADLDKVLETIQKQAATFEKVEREAQDGDQAVIDFEGLLNGEAFEGGTAQDFPLKLGTGSMIEGFEAGILGHKAGDEFELALTFPENYPHKDLAGKDTVFKIKLKEVQAQQLPPIDDSLAEKFNAEGGLAGLKQSLRDNMTREINDRLQAKHKTLAYDALLELNPLTVPDVMIQDEIKRMREQVLQQFKAYGNATPPDFPDSAFESRARKRVQISLLVSALKEDQNISASEDEIKAKVEQIAGQYEAPAEFSNWIYTNKDRLREIEFGVVEDKLADLIYDAAKVEETKLSYQEVMELDQADHEDNKE